MIRTGKTLVINENLEERATQYGSRFMYDGAKLAHRSHAFIPLMIGEQARGREDLAEYLARFPAGPSAGEARRMLRRLEGEGGERYDPQ